MANTISLSPKPGIKCYVGSNRLCDTSPHNTIKPIREITDEDWLWTEESVYCICTHHVEQHCTIRDEYGFVVTIHCHGDNELCNCEHFRTQRLRIANEEEVI